MEPWEGHQQQSDTPSVGKRSFSDRWNDSVWLRRLGFSAIVWGIAPLIWYAGYGLRYITPGHQKERLFDQFFMGNILSGGALFLAWFTVCVIGTVIVLLTTAHRHDNYDYQMNWRPTKLHKNVPTHRTAGVITTIVVALLSVTAVLSSVQFVRTVWNGSIVPSRYVGQFTTIYAPQLNATGAPELTRLLGSLSPGDGKKCDLVGVPSLPSCVKQGTLSTTGWKPRISSLNGATTALTRYSASGNNQSLNTDTVTYLNSYRKQPPVWSGIIDGTGNGTGLGQVAEWNGTTETSCSFAGPYAIDRAFGGSNMADMNDYLAQEYPRYHFTMTDVWGYCDYSKTPVEPVVVVPMVKQIYFASRTVDTYAGIVLIEGDNGHTKLTYVANPSPNQYPGPVYPASLVDDQLSQISWMAGRRAHDDYGFGFAPVESAVQAGNTSDYLLQDAVTGRLEWVTPVTYANSTSNVIIGDAIEYADGATDGSLNHLSLYLFAPGDPRRINIDNLEVNVRNWYIQYEPTFLSNGTGGQLLEFTPVGGNKWRVYGEIKGVVKRLVDVDATMKTAPIVTVINPVSAGNLPNLPSVDCGHPVSNADIATCIAEWGSQLAQRESGNTAGTAPSK